jgi:phenylpropionate dioxygenase-like ring-hydroxylating dioxygenase large terminal subunit
LNYPLNCWYVAASSTDVTAAPLARTLLGQPVVLYRLSSGRVVALADRCPHRSFPLSYGTLDGDDLVCGYHGLAFGPDGACVRVPSQEHVPYDARATVFSVRDEPPFVWIWLGDPGRAALTDPPTLPWLRDPAWATFGDTLQIEANYLLLHDNALDLTHSPFVHPADAPTGYFTAPPPLEIEISETEVAYHRDFPPAPLVDWQAAAMGLGSEQLYAQRESGIFVSPGLHIHRMHVGEHLKVWTRAFTPTGPGSTTVYWQVSRNFRTDRPEVSDLLRQMHTRTLLEDQRIVEIIQARGRADEINITADAAALRARRIVTLMLAQENRPTSPVTGRRAESWR